MLRRLHVPPLRPEDVKRHLAKPELHWKSGYSAKELARCWANAGKTLPVSVQEALGTALEYAGAELIDGFFERDVDLRSRGRNSQTDLMVVIGLGSELSIVAVEGKVAESFGPLFNTWNTTPGKQQRLVRLCETLQLATNVAQDLRYQLIHRAASAIYEAQRYRCRNALMLIHSFSATHRGFEDFHAFTEALGQPVEARNVCSSAKTCEGVALRLVWVAEQITSSSSDKFMIGHP